MKLIFILLFAIGLGVATFSMFFPNPKKTGIAKQRIGKPGLFTRIIDSQHKFLMECGVGERLPVPVFFVARVAAAVAVYLFISGMLGPAVGGLAAIGGFFLPRWFLAPLRARRLRAITEGVIDFGHAFVALMKTGTQPHEAVAVLAGPSGPPAMRVYLTILAQEIRSEGMARAMVKSIDRVADPLFDTLGTAILVQSEKGAELSDALQVTIKNIEQGAILIRRASSLKMQANMAAIITPAMICALVFGFQLHDRGNAEAYFDFYYSAPGQIVEGLVLVLFIAGYFVMRRIQQIPPPPRVKLREK